MYWLIMNHLKLSVSIQLKTFNLLTSLQFGQESIKNFISVPCIINWSSSRAVSN
jgi:hypothetical protein